MGFSYGSINNRRLRRLRLDEDYMVRLGPRRKLLRFRRYREPFNLRDFDYGCAWPDCGEKELAEHLVRFVELMTTDAKWCLVRRQKGDKNYVFSLKHFDVSPEGPYADL